MDPDKQKRIEDEKRQQESAADLIRSKLHGLYLVEPDAKEELREVKALPEKTLSKHQEYMKNLNDSGRNMAEIQTAWHEYYASLDDAGKHEVWQEFYSKHALAKQQDNQSKPVSTQDNKALSHSAIQKATIPHPISNNTAALARKQKRNPRTRRSGMPDMSTANEIRQELITKIQARSEITKNPHVRSLAFGLSMGMVTIFVLLFGFFNERFITPFIRPNSNVSATPIIVDPDATGPVGTEAKIIIPKINVEAPVVYDVPTVDEKDVQKGLENGVVHYITTPNPGEKGNAVIFGHSSSNILNKGKYKFAFILLKSLEKDDTFIIEKDGKRYVYKIYNKYVTSPSDLSVLGPTDKTATVTLVTCDPPGTSTNRLIVQAEQIFPSPSTNPDSKVVQSGIVRSQPKELPSNSVTMWQRIKNWF